MKFPSVDNSKKHTRSNSKPEFDISADNSFKIFDDQYPKTQEEV